jgi:transposase
MLNKHTIFEIHRLAHEDFTVRQIARTLGLNRKSVTKYLNNPDQIVVPHKPKSSILDPFRSQIENYLEQETKVKAPVVLQRLQAQGFDGKVTIVRDLLLELRGKQNKRQAFIRFESAPGKQMQVDWGHFDSLSYGNTKRKLYILAVQESYSRMLFVQATHSQKQEALHQALLNAFHFFGGLPMNWWLITCSLPLLNVRVPLCDSMELSLIF